MTFDVAVDRWIRSDIGEVDRFCENGLDRAWSGVVDKPLYADAGTETRLEPPLTLSRQCVPDETLCVSYVRKMADPQNHLSKGGFGGRKQHRDPKQQAAESLALRARSGQLLLRHETMILRYTGFGNARKRAKRDRTTSRYQESLALFVDR